jgi:hypothetical protein
VSLNNHRLNNLLKRACVPERPAEYWEGFPSQVTRQIRQELHPGKGAPMEPSRFRVSAMAWGIGLAACCVAMGFLIGFWKGKAASPDTQLASMQKYYREVAAMFPNQLQAVIIDDKGPRLVLADAANVPNSSPIFLQVCQAKHCQNFITFSGQQIPVNGERCDVLADAQGNIIVAGQKLVWSSRQPDAARSAYHIRARLMEMQL